MAILHLDGFDHYGLSTTVAATTSLLNAGGYTVVAGTAATNMQIIAAGTGRALQLYNRTYLAAIYNPTVNIPVDGAVLSNCGFQLRTDAAVSTGTTSVATLVPIYHARGVRLYFDTATRHLMVAQTPAGNGNTPATYADTGFTLTQGAAFFLDLAFDTGGVRIYVDNVLIYTLAYTLATDQPCLCPGTNNGNASENSVVMVFDHLYHISATGDTPRLRIGPQVVDTRVPDTVVQTDTWLPNTGSDNIAPVAKLTPNDSTYMNSPASPNNGKQVLYNTSKTPYLSNGTIRAVGYAIRVAKSDTGVRNVGIIGGGASPTGVGISTTFSYKMSYIGGDWTSTRLLNDSFGAEVRE